jgi:hypothetical protein
MFKSIKGLGMETAFTITEPLNNLLEKYLLVRVGCTLFQDVVSMPDNNTNNGRPLIN